MNVHDFGWLRVAAECRGHVGTTPTLSRLDTKGGLGLEEGGGPRECRRGGSI